MESVWWVFGELFKKNLVYRGFRVMPFSTALATPLSNFEAGQDFRDVPDPWLVVNFPVVGEENHYFCAWTTTPWTLPSNLALCVHPEMEYCTVKEAESGKIFYVMKARAFGKGCLYTAKQQAAGVAEVVATFPGKDMVGKNYTPLFDYFVPSHGSTAFRVISDTYVTDESGVGIVHQAPAFGEDDYRVCIREGIATVSDVPCPVDDSGKFTSKVPEWQGRHIKEADKDIIAHLKETGRLESEGTLTHRDAFCWRSGTRLVRKAVDSWFVKVTDLVPDLLTANDATYWVPNHVKEKRFKNWLANARDWNISRNRYWGTPIPLWVSDDFEEMVCISSIAQLEELSGVSPILDLHRETIDDITIPSKEGRGPLKRIKQVFDCWFESGSMPYASKHYPFENKERFEGGFPADFIAEGLDQTRGWFYTLTVLGVALFNKSPFKNLVVNGLVLAEDGKKMSKSLKNYPDPTLVIDKFGSDALRCYLMNSPVVHADELRFKEAGVQAHLKDLFLPWLNALRFFKMAAADYADANGGETFVFDNTAVCPTTNTTDRWILAYAQDLTAFVHQEMKAYRLYTVVPKTFGFVEQLTNWYIRFNRKRLRGSSGDADAKKEAKMAMWTLGVVLHSQCLLMAPFAPFFSEHAYQELKVHIKSAVEAEAAATGAGGAVLPLDSAGVSKWLADNGLDKHSAVFAENGICGKDLTDMTHADLISMGVSVCHERKEVLRVTKPLKIVDPKESGELPSEYKSIHFQMIPAPNEKYVNPEIVAAFEVMKSVVNSGRIIRDRANKPGKYPLKELVIISQNPKKLKDALELQSYIQDELNVLVVTATGDEVKYNIKITAVANQKLLGARLKGDAKKVGAAIAQMTKPEIEAFQEAKKVTILGHELAEADITISYNIGGAGDDSNFMANVDPAEKELIVLLDVVATEEMIMSGVAREVSSNVQKLRQEAGLTPTDPIKIFLKVATESAETKLGAVLTALSSTIAESVGVEVLLTEPVGQVIIAASRDIGKDGAQVGVTICKK
jgi:isoleucyl-tRNA synthetase